MWSYLLFIVKGNYDFIMGQTKIAKQNSYYGTESGGSCKKHQPINIQSYFPNKQYS